MGGLVSRSHPIDAVLWDLDGTLIDTSSSSLHALAEILEENEITLTINQLAPIIEQNMAVSASPTSVKKDKESWAREVLKLTNSSTNLTASDLVKKWDDKMLQRRSEIKLLPYALELVHHFKKHNIPQAIATMSNAKAVAVKKHAQPELFKIIETIVTSSDPDVKNRKPHPDCWFVAASRLNVKTHRCVIIEDSPEGMRSGVSAGAKVVGVPAAWSDKKKIGRGVKVDFMLENGLGDFPCERFGLPKLPRILKKESNVSLKRSTSSRERNLKRQGSRSSSERKK
ncbi:hypothetical protein TL16_g03778 [Triparma laevis f. inornata]|uniref:Uncharacterized protein n=2 Tax=Triparma laevis TaxID=1534972 RepID=A0A9W7AAK2_9STRA|nr:hypothetical protein TL16_g03778 [Triparma laevis f. inornata]GMH64854.1 hypothetical protein TrLO_g4876 [Triparma laevis f. longispina]